MKVSDTQFRNFKNICEKNNEFIAFLNDEELRESVESVIAAQGYWSGLMYRYYLDGDDWRTEGRQFGKPVGE